MTSRITDVAFAVDRDNLDAEVIAVMPGVAGTVGKLDHCTCYVHTGQHHGVDLAVIMGRCKPARISQYYDLYMELLRIGYLVRTIPFDKLLDEKYAAERRKQLELD